MMTRMSPRFSAVRSPIRRLRRGGRGTPPPDWSLRPGDLHSAEVLEAEPRLRGLEDNAVFRLLHRPRRRRLVSKVVGCAGAGCGVLLALACFAMKHPLDIWLMAAGAVVSILGAIRAFVSGGPPFRRSEAPPRGGANAAPSPFLDLTRDEMADLILAGATPEDFVLALWGDAVPRVRARANSRAPSFFHFVAGVAILYGLAALARPTSPRVPVFVFQCTGAILAIHGAALLAGPNESAIQASLRWVRVRLSRAGEAATANMIRSVLRLALYVGAYTFVGTIWNALRAGALPPENRPGTVLLLSIAVALVIALVARLRSRTSVDAEFAEAVESARRLLEISRERIFERL